MSKKLLHFMHCVGGKCRASLSSISSASKPALGQALPKVALIVTVFAVSWLARQARADLVADFRSEYPAAAARAEQAYSHVKIVDQETNYAAPGELWSVQTGEYLRDGDLVRVTDSASQSKEPDLPTGSTFAFGGNPERFYKVRKTDPSKPFVLEAFGPKNKFDLFVRDRARPLFAPYCVFNERVADFLFKDTNPQVSVVSAVRATLDGAPIVTVTAEFTVSGQPNGNGFKRYHFYFQPKTWILLGWTNEYHADEQNGGRTQCRLAYQPETDPPALSSLQYWGDDPSAPSIKYNYSKIDITSLQFGSIPKSEFSVASFGLPEPVTPGTKSRAFWALAINVPILIALGILFVVLAHRRQQRTA